MAHETTHALLDGLRERYTDPSSPDQAGFHEGFADVVALLSVFAQRDVIDAVVDRPAGRADGAATSNLVALKDVTPEAFRDSVLFGLAKQMGQEMAGVRGHALRQSAQMKPSEKYLAEDEYQEPHRRGEILVAAMMNAFLEVWAARLKSLGAVVKGHLDRSRVIEEGANAADYLLTMAIRALDYSMPVHMEFRDYLSALLTADREIRPDDSTYRFRDHLRDSFKAYGIVPSSVGGGEEPGIWLPPKEDLSVWPTGKFRAPTPTSNRSPETRRKSSGSSGRIAGRWGWWRGRTPACCRFGRACASLRTGSFFARRWPSTCRPSSWRPENSNGCGSRPPRVCPQTRR